MTEKVAAEISFRDSTSKDLPEVRRFVAHMYQEDSAAHSGEPDIEKTYRHFAEHPDTGRVVVFSAGGELAGYAIIVYFWSNEFRGNIIDIDEVYVAPPFRSRGIGKQFFEWLKQTHETSAVGWSLQVSETNRRARELYEQLGFAPSPNQHMIRIFLQPVSD